MTLDSKTLNAKTLQSRLLAWYARHGRRLPWRQTKNPYRIVVAEVMLQQTQVERVVQKYRAWIKAFPSWEALAQAPLRDVLRLWSGLGYNSRAARLQKLAQHVLSAGLPEEERSLVQLPGVGPYTAGAIRVFVFNKPGRCIDVNIERVMKRVCFTRRQRPSRRRLQEAVLASFPRGRARAWGNALMDLGSSHCSATRPSCSTCPIRSICKSRGERPEEKRERARRRQSPFLHSTRWWRGQILKVLTQQTMEKSVLYKAIPHNDKAAFENALAALRAEGLVKGVKHLRVGAAP
ncbi:A/G-specific adenine glycosylase [Candidatus Woesearchaeota archaeon]|nr:MAG: A/G-specific adenine glycosylase [Candidatus Woesearchaeota archaeon]